MNLKKKFKFIFIFLTIIRVEILLNYNVSYLYEIKKCYKGNKQLNIKHILRIMWERNRVQNDIYKN